MKKITLLFVAMFCLAFAWQSNAQFTESFDTEIPATWTILNVDGGDTWVHNTLDNYLGAGHARISWDANAHDDYLITPQFTVNAGVSDRISFWAAISSGWTETFEVRLSTTGTAPADFAVVLGSETATVDVATYEKFTYNLSAYDGVPVYIAIRATDTDRFYLHIDEFVNDAAPNCSVPLASYTVVNNCPADNGFSISVDITNIGTASGVTITDNQGTAAMSGVGVGTYTYGTYANATNVVIAVTNDDDALCTTSSSTLTFAGVCPPANDDFANALPVACDDTVTGSTTNATSDNQPTVTTFGVSNAASRNVWYTYTGTGSPELVTLDLCNSSYDTAILVATGAPGSLTWVAGNDDSCGDNGQKSLAQFTSDGTTTYYIMVKGYAVGSYGVYELNVTCEAAIPPPANNECAAAEALTFTTPATGTTAGATQNGAEEQPSCDTFGAIADVWYSVALASAGDLSVNTTLGTATEANVAIYSACGGLAADQVGCSDDNGGESVTATGLDAGTYYVRVWNNGASEAGTFDIVADFTLSSAELNNQDAFTYYPNPVKNTLQLNAQSNIQNVSIFNMLGQEVLRTAPNNVDSTLDMSALQTGAYFVKVTINDRTETIRVVKQ